MEQLPAELLFIISILASVLVWILREVFVKKGREIPVWFYSIVLGVISFGLALLFVPVVLPPFPDHDGSLLGIVAAVLAFLFDSLPAVAAMVAFARFIYEILLQRILDGIGRAIRRLLI